MKKIILGIIIISIPSLSLFAQISDSISLTLEAGKKTIEDTWGCSMLVDVPTDYIPRKGSIEFIIQHRFSNVSNGIKDLAGIYGSSNIRLALSYSIIDRIMVGFGTEKDNKFQEFFAKAKILQQNVRGSIPMSLTLSGNLTISGKEKDYFGSDYHFIDRFSYFSEIIISRKICRFFSFEVAAGYSHINKVEGIKTTKITPSDTIIMYQRQYMNDILAVAAGARINFYNSMSFLLEYDQGFIIGNKEPQVLSPKPSLAIAYEIATPTHCFQVCASNYKGILPQQNFTKNQYDFMKAKGWMLGFNITVRLR